MDTRSMSPGTDCERRLHLGHLNYRRKRIIGQVTIFHYDIPKSARMAVH